MIILTKSFDAQSTSISFKTNPVVGIVGIASFVETTNGTVTAKSFRYTKDGINYTDFQPLTLGNVQALSFANTDTVIFEIRVANTANASVSYSFTSTDTAINWDDTYFKNSIFKQFFNQDNLEVLAWYLNVLEKLYSKGVIPSYVKRTNSKNTDKDFIQFWRSVAKFCAYYVIYARQYQNFYQNTQLLGEFLKQRNVFIHKDQTITELEYLCSHYYREMSKRGTIQIVDHGNFHYNFDSHINGELLRLINFDSGDDLNFIKHKHFGWSLGHSSPCWKGVINEDSCEKYDGTSNYMNVNPYFTYELNLSRQNANSFTVAIDCIDSSGNVLQCKNSLTGASINQIPATKVFRSDVTVYYKYVFYSYDTQASIYDKLYQNQNFNVILPQGAAKIRFTLTDTNGAITGYSFKPCYTNYSRAILGVREWVSFFATNRNGELNNLQLRNTIKRYLIPLNTHLELVYPQGYSQYNVPPTPPVRTKAWRGKDPFCVPFTSGAGNYNGNYNNNYSHVYTPPNTFGYSCSYSPAYQHTPPMNYNSNYNFNYHFIYPNKGYNNLEQYYVDNGLPTGLTKANTIGQPDYIAPSPSPDCLTPCQ